MLLDTSFLIDVLRGAAPAVMLRDEIESGSDAVRVPTVVLYELWEGIARSRNPIREQEIVEDALRSFRVLDLTPEHAMRAGRIAGDLSRRGVKMGDVDLLLSGVALVDDDVVLTRNARDFERIPDLRVRTY